jgi:hypothetical protein
MLSRRELHIVSRKVSNGDSILQALQKLLPNSLDWIEIENLIGTQKWHFFDYCLLSDRDSVKGVAMLIW